MMHLLPAPRVTILMSVYNVRLPFDIRTRATSLAGRR
jgi:hypothetical protein